MVCHCRKCGPLVSGGFNVCDIWFAIVGNVVHLCQRDGFNVCDIWFAIFPQ